MSIQPLQLPSSQAFTPSIDWTPLSQLGDIYRQTKQRDEKEATLRDLGAQFQSGNVDYKQAGGQLIQSGDLQTGLALIKLGDEQEAGKEFTNFLQQRGLGGVTPPQSAAAPQPAPGQAYGPANPVPMPPVTPPTDTKRPAVTPTSRVWGDQEAVDAGLYEPTRVASASTGTMTDAVPLPRPRPPEAPSAQPAMAQAPAQAQEPTPAQQVQQRSAPLPNITGNPATGDAIMPLLAASSNARLPAPQRELAKVLLTKALDDAKLPDDVKKYVFYAQQEMAAGRQPKTQNDWELELKRAGATAITNDMKGEGEESKAAGKAAGERRASMFAAAGSASKTLQNLSRTEALLNQVSQDKLSPATMTISAWAKALGVNDDVATSLGLDPKGVGSAQALQSLVNESVIGKIGSGGFPANNFSDADREFITGIFPRLGDDPQANKIRIEGARRMANLDLQRARDYQSWKKSPGNKDRSFEDFELAWSDKIAKQDVFGDLRQQAESLVGPPRTDIGGTLDNPGPAPRPSPAQQPPAAPQRSQGRTPSGIGWSVN